jgi:hypothetical protein
VAYDAGERDVGVEQVLLVGAGLALLQPLLLCVACQPAALLPRRKHLRLGPRNRRQQPFSNRPAGGPCDAGGAALGPGDRRKFRGAGPPGSDLLRGQAFRCGFLCVFLWLCCADWHRRPGRAGEGGCRWLRVLARRAFSFRRSRRDATALVGGAGGISGTNKWMWANMFW